MTRFLVFRLDGPMAAWGATAFGERRLGWDTPSRSAVLGLVCAAAGISNAQAARQAALSDALGFSVRSDRKGRQLSDYHTAQTRRPSRAVPAPVRPLEGSTVLSEREYLVDVRATVALWARTSPSLSLDAIAEALRRPQHILFLGRRSCPLGRPPVPKVIEAADPLAALVKYDRDDPDPNPGREASGRIDDEVELWCDLDPQAAWSQRLGHVRERRDIAVDRSRWQFGSRDEGRWTVGALGAFDG